MNGDYYFIVLLFMLLVFPKVLQRFGIPSAITSLMIGLLSGPIFGIIQPNVIISTLSILGIVTLFLFAGLEADVDQLLEKKSVLIQHVIIFFIQLALATFIFQKYFDFSFHVAALIAIGLLTPSTGFILHSLKNMNISSEDQFWIKTKAISAEIFALAVLFMLLQSLNATKFLFSTAALFLIIYGLPLIFKAIAKWIIPYAPNSEFTFLIMVAVSCAVITKDLGVYYLVGAFIVGLSAQRFRERLPSFSSEKMMDSIELFSSFFIPFYFFKAGLGIPKDALTIEAAIFGMIFLIIFVPLRIFSVGLHRAIVLKEKISLANRIGTKMIPTLVFTLVLVQILKDQFNAPPFVLGAMIIYTICNTILPAIIFKERPVEFENQQATDIVGINGN